MCLTPKYELLGLILKLSAYLFQILCSLKTTIFEPMLQHGNLNESRGSCGTWLWAEMCSN